MRRRIRKASKKTKALHIVWTSSDEDPDEVDDAEADDGPMEQDDGSGCLDLDGKADCGPDMGDGDDDDDGDESDFNSQDEDLEAFYLIKGGKNNQKVTPELSALNLPKWPGIGLYKNVHNLRGLEL